MWIADLAPFTDGPEEYLTERMLAVGYLARHRPFETGRVKKDFFLRVCKLLRAPWEPWFAMGFHECEVCQFRAAADMNEEVAEEEDEDEIPEQYTIIARTSTRAYVPGDGVIYVTNGLLPHYINAHRYRPPDEFHAAVMCCPPMSSPAYFEALRANGGRGLFRE